MHTSPSRERAAKSLAPLLCVAVCLAVRVHAAEAVPAGSASPPPAEAPLANGFYIVHPDDADGRVQVMLGEQKYFAEPKPFLEASGVASASIEHQQAPPPPPGAPAAGQPPIGIRVTMTKEGTATLASATAQAAGFRLGVVVDGEVVAMPVIREPVTSGMMVISGSFSEERAKAIVAALAPKKAAR